MTDPVARAVGHRIRQARLGLGLSQEKLARELDIPMMTLSKWERGLVKRPDRYVLSRLEQMAGYREGFIMNREEKTSASLDEGESMVKVSVSKGQVVFVLTLHPNEVDAVINQLREAKAEAMKFRQGERP